MKDLHLLLFELSSEDRLRILELLSEEPMNVTGLSRHMDLAVQEASRHLSRLEKVGLTERDLDGRHHVTMCGELVIRQLPGLDFISRNKDYFSSHSLKKIPPEFICRLGELRDSTLVDDVVIGFYNVNKMLRNAEDFIWTMTDRYIMSHLPIYAEAIGRGVRVKNLELTTLSPPENNSGIDPQAINDIHERRLDGSLEENVLDELDVYLFLSEKEVACIAFPQTDGKFDYLGFRSENEAFRKWCSDLYEHYWKKSTPRPELVEEEIRWLLKNSDAVEALKAIGNGESIDDEALISELETHRMVKNGRTTLIGQLALMKLFGAGN